MLLRFKVKNFLSFHEEVSFDMFPNPKRTSFPNHVYSDMEIPLLKMASIYGANGSGKSNLLNALRFLTEFAVTRDLLKRVAHSNEKFLLAEEDNENPINFSVEFFHQEKYLIYTVTIADSYIESESLYSSGLGEKEDRLIFRRNQKEYSAAMPISDEIKRAAGELLEKNPLASLLFLNSEFPIIEAEEAKIAFDWFKSCCYSLPIRKEPNSLIGLYDANPDLLCFANKLLRLLGLGIEHVEVNVEKYTMFIKSGQASKIGIKQPDDLLAKENRSLQVWRNDVPYLLLVNEGKGEPEVKKLLFELIGKDGYHGKLDFYTQSDGTVAILNLIPAIYDVITKKCVFFIDELEASIHPSLVMRLVNFVSKEKTKGQLIFTTHLTALLDQQKLMRPDEVWFTEKHEGSTQLYSLNDFKEHNTINIEKGYLQGRYGAIPFIGNLENILANE